MPPLTDKELERRLNEAGKNLLRPPSSVDELLSVLDRTLESLSKVEQSPAKSMQTALTPLTKALVSEALMKHSDVDVKVGVASCISEITRITAPDAPYGDDKMKDVFQLIVSSFEGMSDTSSRSHEKRATILETVAKVRSCVIMLDLEFDDMIIEMFQHFLKNIREYHVNCIFESMEAIMTLVIEESEDVSADLLHPILSTLKNDNEAVLPISKKLAARVLQNCAEKLAPYLTLALKTSHASLDDYSEVVASVCRGNNGTSVHSNGNIGKDESGAEDRAEETHPQDGDSPVNNKSPKSTVNNETGNEETMTDAIVNEIATDEATVTKEAMTDAIVNETATEEAVTDAIVNETAAEETMTDADHLKEADNNLSDGGAKKPEKLKANVGCTSKRKGRQVNPKKDSADSSNLRDDTKQAEQVPNNQELSGEDVHSSPMDVEAVKSLDGLKDTSNQFSPSEVPKDDDVTVASLNQSGSLPKKNRSKKSVKGKRKGFLVMKEKISAETASKKASNETKNSEAMKQQCSVEKTKDKASCEEDASDTESRSLDQTEKPELRSLDELKDTNIQLSPTEPKEDDFSVASQNLSDSLPKVSRSKRSGLGKKKGTLGKKEKMSVNTALKKPSEEMKNSEAKKQQRSVKKQPVETAKDNDGLSTSDTESKSLDQIEKTEDASNEIDDESPAKNADVKTGGKVTKDMMSVVTASKKASKGKTSSKAKKKKSTVKKRHVEIAKDKTSHKEPSRNDGGSTSDTTRSLDPAEKSEDDASNEMDVESPSRNEDSKKSGRSKKSSERDHGKGKVTLPESPLLKSAKDEHDKEETPRTSVKRKRTPGTEKASKTIKYGRNLVGSKVQVWWPDDEMFYQGEISSYDYIKKKHTVLYDDGEEEVLNLRKERWEFVGDDQVPEEEGQAVEDASSDTSSDVQRKKKGTASSEASTKRVKLDNSTQGKLKATATKSSVKSKDDDNKAEPKSKDKNSKSVAKSEDDTIIKSKDRSKKGGGKSHEDSSAKPSGKSKDVDVAKTPTQSKQDSQKTSKAKGKTPQSVKTPSTNDISMTKSSTKEKSMDSIKLSDMVKGKLPNKGMSKESEKKSGKKRRR